MKYIIAHITDKCNYKCKTCLRNTKDSLFHNNDLDINLLKKHIPDLKTMGYSSVAITGGEPCMHKKFEEIINYFINENMKIGIVSNGSMIQKYKFLLAKKDYINYFCFSLDGIRNIHDKIRVAGSFNKVIKAIKWSVKNDIYTKISFCINKINMEYLDDLIKLCYELKINELNILGIIKTDLNKELWLTEDEKKKISEKVKKYLNKHFRINICTSVGIYEDANFCSSAEKLTDLAINPQGNLIFCCDTIGDGAVIGSLYKEDFFSLYGKALRISAHLRRKRKKMKEERETFDGFNTCDFCNFILKDYIDR